MGRYEYTDTVTTFDFTDGNSGYVSLTGFFYGFGTGSNNCDIAQDITTGYEKRAMFKFDTSSLGAAGIAQSDIIRVEWRRVDALAQGLNPSTKADLYMGNWISVPLAGNAANFNGGNDMGLDILFSYNNDDWINLDDAGFNPIQYVDVNGDTDIALHDTTASPTPTTYDFNRPRRKVQLRVTSRKSVWVLPKVVMIFGKAEGLICYSSMDLQAQ